MKNIIKTSINNLYLNIKSGNIKSVDVINTYLMYIKKLNLKLKTFVYLNEISSLRVAEQIDNKIKNGENIDLLSGIPIGIKDNIMVQNEPMTSASKYLLGYISPYNATVINKLKKINAICIGRTNMDEFAMGCTTETSIYYKTVNPWNPEYIPGGSSGGSAVAVSAGMVPIALGTDTGGSVRQPASFCGIVGYKPSYGLISRYGVCALASSFDQVGTLAKTVQDTVLIASKLIGYDNKDPISEKINHFKECSLNTHILKNVIIGIPKQISNYKIDNEILKLFHEAISKLENSGIKVVEVNIPAYKYVSALYKVIMCAEVSSNIATFDGVRYGYRYNSSKMVDVNTEYAYSRAKSLGYEVKKRIMFGTYVLTAKNYQKYYYQAQKVRTILIEQLKEVYKTCNFIFSPAVLQMPVKLGEVLSDECDIFLIIANLAGMPGITIPYAFTKSLGMPMPLGMHFMGPRFSDVKLFQMAYIFEKLSGFDINKYPDIK
jgi:aspartyl-tRNA(Asn)/glutamyl-tRNA(Gln) amidotransferase subunit A